MQKAVINVTFGDNTFTSTITSENPVPEYMIADKAYRLAIMFADTQVISRYGHRLPAHQFGELLRDLDYTYSIEEVSE